MDGKGWTVHFRLGVECLSILVVLITNEGRTEREIDRRIRVAFAIMWTLFWSVVMGVESVYRSVYIPTLTYGHALLVVTERYPPATHRNNHHCHSLCLIIWTSHLKPQALHNTCGMLAFNREMEFFISHCAILLELIPVSCPCQLCFWWGLGRT